MEYKSKIVVTGATGNLGRAVVQKLTQKGFNVIAGTTNPENKKEVNGVKTQRFVLEDIESVKAALQDASGLFLIAPPMDPESDQKLIPVIDRAKEAGLEHIVFNSALGVDLAEESPHNRIEKYLAASGVNYTILRPNFFMENFSAGFLAPMIAQGGIFLAAGDGRTSFISVQDIAAVAAVSFEQKRYGQAYNLTGSQALDHTEVAEQISEVIGKPVQYHDLTEEDMLQGARDNGMPEGSVQMMGALYAAVRDGFMAAVTPDVKELTGKDPVLFDAFVRENRSAWV